MNSKKLLITFAAVSVAALIVSSFAVFAVARTYSTALLRNQTEGEIIALPEISASLPEESISRSDTASQETSECETSTEANDEITVSATEEATSSETTEEETPEQTISSVGFTLTLSDGRLIIRTPEGEIVYERIVDESDLRTKDRDALKAGIDFPDQDDAMSAVYDLIS